MKKILLKITLTLLLVALFGTFSLKAAKFNFASTDDFPTVYATMADGDTLWLTTPGSTAQYTNLALANNTLTKSLTIMADPSLSSRPILFQATFGAYNLANVYTKFEFVGFEAFYYQPTDVPLDSKYFLDIRSITSVGTLKFKNCYIHGYTRDVVRADAGTPVITNLLVDNCLFFDNGRCAASYPVFGIKSATGVTNISFTNTTFINCPSNIITYSNGATALTFLMQNCSVIDCGNYQTRSGTSPSYSNSAAANLFNFTVAANAASTFTIDKSIISGSFTAADAANFTFNDAVNCVALTTTNVVKLNTATATNVNFTNSVILGNTFNTPATPGGTYTPITANSLTYNFGTMTITTDPASITGIGDPRWYLNSSAPLSNDATLSDLKIDGTTVNGFAAGTTTYSVVLPVGTTIVPTITATVNEAHATTVITPAPSVTTAGTVEVTAQDGSKKTYTVNFSVAALQSQTITFTLPTGKVYGDAASDITGVTSGGSGNPVVFTSTNTAVATVTGSTITILTAGTTTIKANQAGNSSYSAAVEVTNDLVIGKAALTVTTEPATRMKGLANPVFVLKYTGFKGTDTKASLTTEPTATCAATTTSAVGNYPVVVSGGAATNYTFTYVDGTLAVTVNTGTSSLTGVNVKAYPNPVVSGKLTIEVPSYDAKSTVTLSSIAGVKVITKKIESDVTELNLKAVAPGLYIIRIETPDGVTIKQIVKQ